MDKELIDIVFSYPKLKERLNKNPKDRSKSLKILEECKGNFNPKVVNSISKFLDFTFVKLYDGISFEIPDDMDLPELVKNKSVVLVPNHQSHVDYIALTYCVYNKYKIPIYVAGGINLNIFPIGYLFRNAGCFFIRRSFQSDILYKLTFEAYLYYLLKKGFPIEFFFEGGRSRTGKLLPPRFGMFSMLIDIYSTMKKDIGRDIVFLPVSIVHENVPEGKAHLKELKGAKKSKENTGQLLKLYKLFSKQFGAVHIKVGSPLKVSDEVKNVRDVSREIAFECYRKVGEQMMVTPTSILALVLLDDTSSVLTWEQIIDSSKSIVNYCREFDVPLSRKLGKGREIKFLKKALSQLLKNKKIELVRNKSLGYDYYSVSEGNRSELLYFKNTILHHFLVPYIISSSWVYFLNGTIKNYSDLKNYLLKERKQLKYEFYLPKIKDLLTLALKIISNSTNEKINNLEKTMQLSSNKMYSVANKVGVFSKSFNYIFEAYYLSALTIKKFDKNEFTMDQFLKASREVFDLEIKHGRVIRYPESYTVPLMRNSLSYFENLEIIKKDGGNFSVQKPRKLDATMLYYTKHLSEMLTVNLKLNQV